MVSKARKSPVYKISWMDRFFNWVDGLPIPFLPFYFLVYLGIVLFQHVLLWLDGSLAAAEFAPIIFIQNIWSIFIVAAWHYLRNAGSLALTKFRPALEMGEAEFNTLKTRFTNLPARTGWIITALALLVYLIAVPSSKEFVGPLFFSRTTIYLTFLVLLFAFPMNSAFFVVVIRSLFAISSVYDRVKRINLYSLNPLYALSAFTSRVGMIFIAFVLINLATSSLYGEGFTLFYLILFGLCAVLVFVLPLLGIHQRLAEKKEELLTEAGEQVHAAFNRLSKERATGKLKEIGNTRQLVDATIREREYIQAVPTWPWNAGTLRTFITALLVPMSVWIVQQVLLRTVVK